MNNHLKIRVLMVLAGLVFIFLGMAVLSGSSWGARLFGKEIYSIQNFMWLAFFIGFAELLIRHIESRKDVIALQSKYLLEGNGVFYNQEFMAQTMTNVYDKDDRLAHLIQVLFMRYQASNKSTEETHQMLNSQLEMMQFKLDVQYNMIRYISWLIPTLGFIGTVVGISDALAYAGIPGNAERSDFVSNLTSELAVAFDTTLLALIMSALLVYVMHIIQGREENVIQHCGEYTLNNFINKLMGK
jgi:flagellar motor component MotA